MNLTMHQVIQALHIPLNCGLMVDLGITFDFGTGEFLKMTETREAVQDTQPPGP